MSEAKAIPRTDPRLLSSGLLTDIEAAAWLGVSRSTFYKLDMRSIEVGGKHCIRYDIKDLQAWADANGNIAPMRRTG